MACGEYIKSVWNSPPIWRDDQKASLVVTVYMLIIGFVVLINGFAINDENGDFSLANLGTFIGGVGAPVGLLYLIAQFRLQRRQAEEQGDAIKNQMKKLSEFVDSTNDIAKTAIESRREVELDVAQKVVIGLMRKCNGLLLEMSSLVLNPKKFNEIEKTKGEFEAGIHDAVVKVILREFSPTQIHLHPFYTSSYFYMSTDAKAYETIVKTNSLVGSTSRVAKTYCEFIREEGAILYNSPKAYLVEFESYCSDVEVLVQKMEKDCEEILKIISAAASAEK